MKYARVRELLKQASTAFTSVGCYPTYAVMEDGQVLCAKCVAGNRKLIERAMLNPQSDPRWSKEWTILGVEANWEDPNLSCSGCNERIESAYAEAEALPMCAHGNAAQHCEVCHPELESEEDRDARPYVVE